MSKDGLEEFAESLRPRAVAMFCSNVGGELVRRNRTWERVFDRYEKKEDKGSKKVRALLETVRGYSEGKIHAFPAETFEDWEARDPEGFSTFVVGLHALYEQEAFSDCYRLNTRRRPAA